MDGIDWARIFVPDTPPLEIFIRGSLVYLSLFVLLRFVMRREAGALGLTDLLVIVLIADAAQNAMAGEYHSVTDGVLLVMVILGWSFLLSWLASRHAFWRRVVMPARVQLVREGRILRHNLDRELITEEELMGELRGHGIDKLELVRAAYMESDGMISVIRRSRGSEDAPRKRRAG